jgi:hypothetical protein
MYPGQVSFLISQLELARDQRNADAVDDALTPLFSSMPIPALVPLLCELLVMEFHTRHEDMIRLLQNAADSRAIPFLREAVLLKARLGYLDYDDYGSYYKKCFWALKAINNPEAISVIREFASSDDPAIREQAVYRLSKWS